MTKVIQYASGVEICFQEPNANAKSPLYKVVEGIKIEKGLFKNKTKNIQILLKKSFKYRNILEFNEDNASSCMTKPLFINKSVVDYFYELKLVR